MKKFTLRCLKVWGSGGGGGGRGVFQISGLKGGEIFKGVL